MRPSGVTRRMRSRPRRRCRACRRTRRPSRAARPARPPGRGAAVAERVGIAAAGERRDVAVGADAAHRPLPVSADVERAVVGRRRRRAGPRARAAVASCPSPSPSAGDAAAGDEDRGAVGRDAVHAVAVGLGEVEAAVGRGRNAASQTEVIAWRRRRTDGSRPRSGSTVGRELRAVAEVERARLRVIAVVDGERPAAERVRARAERAERTRSHSCQAMISRRGSSLRRRVTGDRRTGRSWLLELGGLQVHRPGRRSRSGPRVLRALEPRARRRPCRPSRTCGCRLARPRKLWRNSRPATVTSSSMPLQRSAAATRRSAGCRRGRPPCSRARGPISSARSNGPIR